MGKQYKIVQSGNLRDLEIEVNELIKLGWTCVGGMVMQDTQIGPSNLFQTMIKKRSKNLLESGPR